jgi:hypothetical protein
MAHPLDEFPVYLEIGQKRTFAGALDWPGWCRAGRDEAAALVALYDHAPRYAHALQSAGLDFVAPSSPASLVVVERLPGSSGTDFGAPGAMPSADERAFGEGELARSQALLRAIWQAFDHAAADAVGRELRVGPRGGGRDLNKIVDHVRGADEAYLARLAWKRPKGSDPAETHALVRQATLDALAAAAQGELPERGPRGGSVWRPRFFVRYVAWHTLDHAWEIEDRVIE